MRQLARTHAFWLALVRIYTGYFFFSKGFAKLMALPPFNSPQGFLTKFLNQAVSGTSGFYHDFLVRVVVPNASTFGFLVEFGEMVAGVLLILGVFTRLGAILAMFLVFNYWLASGHYAGLEAYNGLDWAAFALAFVSLVLPTGRFLGLDAFAKKPVRVQPVVTAPGAPAAAPYTPPPAYSPPPHAPAYAPPPQKPVYAPPPPYNPSPGPPPSGT